MKKQIKKCVAMFLVVMMLLFDIGSISAGATSSSVQEDSTGYTTTTWDFSDETQLTDDFQLYKRNSDGVNFQVTDGYLSAAVSTEDDCRKAVLNTEYDVKTASVDLYPVSGVYYGGIMLGITGTVGGGTTANPSIMISLEDSGTGGTWQKLRVYGYDANKKEHKILDTGANALIYSSNEAQAVNLKIDMSESKLMITITPLSGTITPYQCEVDIAEYTYEESKVFTSDSLKGKIGLFARATATKFDDFKITCASRIYDFNDSTGFAEDFSLYKRNSDGVNFQVTDGYLSAAVSTEDDCRKAVLNTEYDIKTASVDLYPVSGVYYGGIMLGITGTVGGGTTANPSIMISLEDSGTGGTWQKLRVYGYDANKKEHKILDTGANALIYSDNEAQAVNLKIEISGAKLVITITPLSGTITPYQCEVDIAEYTYEGSTVFTSESLKGKIGLFARATATNFDNFNITYAPADAADDVKLTIGGMNNSTVTVSKNCSLPTGADIVDGKYILGWTMTTTSGDGTVVADKVSVSTYYGASCGNLTYTYEANVVDPAMLTVSFQEAVSEKGEAYYDVRFAAALNDFDFADYKRAGFVFSKDETVELVVDAANCMTRSTTRLYASLNANSESVTPGEIYTSDNDYAEYFFAREIIGIPSGETVYVRAFLELSNGYIVYGEPTSITVPYTEAQ